MTGVPRNNLAEHLARYSTEEQNELKKYYTKFKGSRTLPSGMPSPFKPPLSFIEKPPNSLARKPLSHTPGRNNIMTSSNGPSNQYQSTPRSAISNGSSNQCHSAPRMSSALGNGPSNQCQSTLRMSSALGNGPRMNSAPGDGPSNQRANSLHLSTSSTFNTAPLLPSAAPATSNAKQQLSPPVCLQGSLGSYEDSPRKTSSPIPGSSLSNCTHRIQHESPSDVRMELESVHSERVSVMDDICELLGKVASSHITSVFGSNAGHVQKKLAVRRKLLLREESLKAFMAALPDSPSSSTSGSNPPTLPFRSLLSEAALETHSSPQTHLSRPTTTSRGEVSTSSSSHSVRYPGDECWSSDPVSDEGAAGCDAEEDDWGFILDNIENEDPHQYPPGPPQFNSTGTSWSNSTRTPQSCSSGTPQPYHSEPVDTLAVASPPYCSQSPTHTRNPPTMSSKKPFQPPFLQPNNRERLDTSFGKALGKQSMFKPSGTNTPPPDDAAEFRGQYKHEHEMYKVFNQVFGLKRFRPKQLEAINAVTLGKDCFVLMPTGGGKSLCYQLPALMTPGVTIVVSPLRSLIQDQVQKLGSLGIPVRHLSSDLSAAEEGEVYRCLSLREPTVKLLYVTPEKLGTSNKLHCTLQGLHNRQMLARFVIDEAHCISQWGHDFRPDYKKLSELRQKFRGVPIVALTATATPRVRADILNQLDMLKTCKWFTQSFDRINLKYSVVPKKPKKVIQDIIALIQQSFSGLSGIIYCLSRRDCQIMAEELCRANIAGQCYHAGLSDDERSTVQQRWAQGVDCKVVCATIAFGMGIDKPDVRFVIHHSLPKSVEGYFQEAGRAGRDGKTAQCILFYSYSDMARLRRMVKSERERPRLSYTQEKVHMDNLYRMVQYCENMADCRRVQLLEYFAESFDPEQCKNGDAPCDNCQSSLPFVTQDITELVKVIVRSVEQVGKDKYTLNQYLEAVKGSTSQRVTNGELSTLPLYAKGNKMTKHDLERLLHMLVMQDVLSESLTIGAHDNVVCYVKPGSKARDVLSGRISDIVLKVRGSGKATSGAQKAATTLSRADKLKAECLKALHALRLSVTMQHKLKNPEYVVSSAGLQGMADTLPTSKEELLNVEGFTALKWDRFNGQEFLNVTAEYAREVGEVTSSYFKGSTEGSNSRPPAGRGKRKKAGHGDTPQVKKACRTNTANQLPVWNFMNGTGDSDDEFEDPKPSRPPPTEELPKQSRLPPSKGLRLMSHPNN